MASKKQKFEVYHQLEKRMVEVDGTPVEIDGYSNLFVHKPITKGGKWAVSEMATGRFVVLRAETIVEAKEMAKERLDGKGREEFDRAVEECVRRGLTTRWYRENVDTSGR